jgi:hypothetical protein
MKIHLFYFVISFLIGVYIIYITAEYQILIKTKKNKSNDKSNKCGY